MPLAQVTAGNRIVTTDANQFYNLLKGVAASGETITLIYNAAGVIIFQPSSDPAAGTELFQIKNNAGTVQGSLSSDGKLFAADGTASVPGISFESDKDTGIYRTGANALAVTAGGSLVSALAAATVSASGFMPAADKQKLTSQAVTGGTITWDASSGADYELTTNANVAVTITNLIAGQWTSLTIDYTGAHTVTFTTTINWVGGTTPAATSANGKTDIFAFKRNHAGTKIYGVANLNFTT